MRARLLEPLCIHVNYTVRSVGHAGLNAGDAGHCRHLRTAFGNVALVTNPLSRDSVIYSPLSEDSVFSKNL